MGLLSSSDKYPQTKKITINPKMHNAGELGKKSRKYIAEKIIQKKNHLEIGDEFRLADTDGKYEVLKISPEPSIPTSETVFTFKNRIIYEKSYNKFDVKEDRIIELEEKPDLEEPTKIKKPEDFAKIIDTSSSLIEYYPEEELYIFGNSYYYQFTN